MQRSESTPVELYTKDTFRNSLTQTGLLRLVRMTGDGGFHRFIACRPCRAGKPVSFRKRSFNHPAQYLHRLPYGCDFPFQFMYFPIETALPPLRRRFSARIPEFFSPSMQDTLLDTVFACKHTHRFSAFQKPPDRFAFEAFIVAVTFIGRRSRGQSHNRISPPWQKRPSADVPPALTPAFLRLRSPLPHYRPEAGFHSTTRQSAAGPMFRSSPAAGPP